MSKASALREQNDEQLELLLGETQQGLFRLRLQSETERLEAPSEIIKAKREIARIKTILHMRHLERVKAQPPAAATAPVAPAPAPAATPAPTKSKPTKARTGVKA